MIALLCLLALASCQAAPHTRVVLAVHGGAGTILKANMNDELDAEYRAKLAEALRAGHAVLSQGGSAVDAVVASVLVMEDSPLFNAGLGAVLTSDGHCELDASIMRGEDREGGAVAGVRTVRNPILAARAVMEDSEHVLLAGDGADSFAREQGLEPVENEYFKTERRQRQLERWKERSRDGAPTSAEDFGLPDGERKHGTVGAVALDSAGHLAAATSTGGMTGKRWGRVGDSPILGAGTWAEDTTCAVSGTGWGEYFIRGTIARDVAARMEYQNLPLEQAAADTVELELGAAGGTGGIIALDGQGTVASPFNTPGMYRGWIDEQGQVTVRIFGDEGP